MLTRWRGWRRRRNQLDGCLLLLRQHRTARAICTTRQTVVRHSRARTHPQGSRGDGGTRIAPPTAHWHGRFPTNSAGAAAPENCRLRRPNPTLARAPPASFPGQGRNTACPPARWTQGRLLRERRWRPFFCNAMNRRARASVIGRGRGGPPTRPHRPSPLPLPPPLPPACPSAPLSPRSRTSTHTTHTTLQPCRTTCRAPLVCTTRRVSTLTSTSRGSGTCQTRCSEIYRSWARTVWPDTVAHL